VSWSCRVRLLGNGQGRGGQYPQQHPAGQRRGGDQGQIDLGDRAGPGDDIDAKKAEALFRISLARRSSRFSRSRALRRHARRCSGRAGGRRRPQPFAPTCGASRADAELGRDGADRCPLRVVLVLVLEHHPDGPLSQLLRIPPRSGHSSDLSRVGASRNPGAVQKRSPQRIWTRAIGSSSEASWTPAAAAPRLNCWPARQWV
jgi:hypothetical protein